MKKLRGFTLIEMMIAVVLLSIVLTGALRLFRAVNTAVAGTVDRMDAMQNLRFGISQVDLLLRNAGTGTTDAQPTLIYIGPSVMAFNADWISLLPNSPTAVNFNPDADSTITNAPTTSQQFTIPTSSILYPDSTYRTAGAISPAEAIVYWFALDTSTSRTDDYVLWRQVNNSAPNTVARNFLPYPGRPFFEWMRTDAAGNLQTVAGSSLPWRHSNPIHGSLTDTGLVGQIDSIRAVRVNIQATNGQIGSREIRRLLVTTVRIPNAGLSKQRSCGDAPIFTSAVGWSFQGPAGSTYVRLTWTPATDELTGERDVERYLIYRRLQAGAFDDALAQVPAGQVAYQYDDPTVLFDSSYVYGVTALDCTPLESSLRSSTATGPVP